MDKELIDSGEIFSTYLKSTLFEVKTFVLIFISLGYSIVKSLNLYVDSEVVDEHANKQQVISNPIDKNNLIFFIFNLL